MLLACLSRCMRYNSYWIVWITLRGTVISGSLCLRIYALYERSRRILVIMVVANMLVIVVALWLSLYQGAVPMELHPEGCVVQIRVDSVFQRIIPWILTIVIDSLLFSLTLWKSWSMRHHHGFNAQVLDPLIGLLIRDGAVYYVFMLLGELANVITYYSTQGRPSRCQLEEFVHRVGLFIKWDYSYLDSERPEGDTLPHETRSIFKALTLPALESLALVDAAGTYHYSHHDGDDNEDSVLGFCVDPLMEMLERSYKHSHTGTGLKLKKLGLWTTEMTGEQLLKLLKLECMNTFEGEGEFVFVYGDGYWGGCGGVNAEEGEGE
ncbi:hypothetical protein D9758_009547 [Tetrapyrgos nigripes]|uniref:Uncharacterized protein n=1 Tax=Tetrapyrgos nigripes TaxID=182062 RepID=A0A8H5LEC3_9AGAR|nr:hypothetical protein D9758_009547 [Tetrapyrgos nigripes]